MNKIYKEIRNYIKSSFSDFLLLYLLTFPVEILGALKFNNIAMHIYIVIYLILPPFIVFIAYIKLKPYLERFNLLISYVKNVKKNRLLDIESTILLFLIIINIYLDTVYYSKHHKFFSGFYWIAIFIFLPYLKNIEYINDIIIYAQKKLEYIIDSEIYNQKIKVILLILYIWLFLIIVYPFANYINIYVIYTMYFTGGLLITYKYLNNRINVLIDEILAEDERYVYLIKTFNEVNVKDKN